MLPKQSVVGLLLDRQPSMIVAILAVLEAPRASHAFPLAKPDAEHGPGAGGPAKLRPGHAKSGPASTYLGRHRPKVARFRPDLSPRRIILDRVRPSPARLGPNLDQARPNIGWPHSTKVGRTRSVWARCWPDSGPIRPVLADSDRTRTAPGPFFAIDRPTFGHILSTSSNFDQFRPDLWQICASADQLWPKSTNCGSRSITFCRFQCGPHFFNFDATRAGI